jgi:hypothetical protein
MTDKPKCFEYIISENDKDFVNQCTTKIEQGYVPYGHFQMTKYEYGQLLILRDCMAQTPSGYNLTNLYPFDRNVSPR